MAMPEDWTTQNSIEVALCAVFAAGGAFAVGYVVWHTLPYLLAAAAGAGAVVVYAGVRGSTSQSI